MLLIFLDTETTGLNPEKHRTLDIAFRIVDVLTGKHVVSFESIVSQPAEVWAGADPESLQINGFTWELNLQGKSEKMVASEISNDLNRAGLGEKEGAFVCQNPSFDRAFFNQMVSVELQEHYGWPYHWLDLASMYWALLMKEDQKKAGTLLEKELSKNKIAAALNLPPEDSPHRAMKGVNHLITCYDALFGS